MIAHPFLVVLVPLAVLFLVFRVCCCGGQIIIYPKCVPNIQFVSAISCIVCHYISRWIAPCIAQMLHYCSRTKRWDGFGAFPYISRLYKHKARALDWRLMASRAASYVWLPQSYEQASLYGVGLNRACWWTIISQCMRTRKTARTEPHFIIYDFRVTHISHGSRLIYACVWVCVCVCLERTE